MNDPTLNFICSFAGGLIFGGFVGVFLFGERSSTESPKIDSAYSAGNSIRLIELEASVKELRQRLVQQSANFWDLVRYLKLERTHIPESNSFEPMNKGNSRR